MKAKTAITVLGVVTPLSSAAIGEAIERYFPFIPGDAAVLIFFALMILQWYMLGCILQEMKKPRR